MRRRRDDAAYAPCPRGRFVWRRLIWLICGMGMVAAMVFGMANVLSGIRLPAHRDFPGELRPARDPVTIVLPAGVYLDQILVERGEEVRAGQTVATLDIAAMETRLAEIERQIAADNTHRSCLLGMVAAIDPLEGSEPEQAALSEIARRDCAARQEQRAAAEAQAAVDRSILKERRNLFDNYLTLSIRRIAEGPQKQAQARMALSLALSRNILDHRISALDDLALQEQGRFQRETIEQARDLSERIVENLRLQAVLRRYLQAPRLQSPDNGRVNRIRPVQAGLSLSEPAEMLEITPSDQASFVARFTVPADAGEVMQPGMPVQMRLLGGWQATPTLYGTINAEIRGQGDEVVISVDLSSESVDSLTAPAEGVALRGVGTASALRVKLADYQLGAELMRELSVLKPRLPVDLMASLIP